MPKIAELNGKNQLGQWEQFSNIQTKVKNIENCDETIDFDYLLSNGLNEIEIYGIGATLLDCSIIITINAFDEKSFVNLPQ